MRGECFSPLCWRSCCGFTSVSIHICAGNVLCDAYIRHFSSYGLFQLIYVRGMFPTLRISIHICAGNVSPAGDALVAVGVVSTHICAENVSCGEEAGGKAACSFNSYIRGECFCYGPKFYRAVLMFRFIYARGMFQGMMLLPTAFWRFNSYMREECFGRQL